MKRSEYCKQEKTDEAVVHLNPTEAASTQPWWNCSSRWERAQAWQQIQALQKEFNRRFDGLHQVPATPMHVSGRGGGEEIDEEEEQRAASRWVNQARRPQLRVSCWFSF